MKKRYVWGIAALVAGILVIGLLGYQAFYYPKRQVSIYTLEEDPVEIIRYSLKKDRVLTYNGEKFTRTQPGDTLSEISQLVGKSQEELIKLNRITNPDDLALNQILRLDPPKEGSAGTLPGILDFPDLVIRVAE